MTREPLPAHCLTVRITQGPRSGGRKLGKQLDGFKELTSGREKYKYKDLYNTMRNVIVGALDCREINLDQREVNFRTPK